MGCICKLLQVLLHMGEHRLAPGFHLPPFPLVNLCREGLGSFLPRLGALEDVLALPGVELLERHLAELEDSLHRGADMVGYEDDADWAALLEEMRRQWPKATAAVQRAIQAQEHVDIVREESKGTLERVRHVAERILTASRPTGCTFLLLTLPLSRCLLIRFCGAGRAEDALEHPCRGSLLITSLWTLAGVAVGGIATVARLQDKQEGSADRGYVWAGAVAGLLFGLVHLVIKWLRHQHAVDTRNREWTGFWDEAFGLKQRPVIRDAGRRDCCDRQCLKAACSWCCGSRKCACVGATPFWLLSIVVVVLAVLLGVFSGEGLF